MWLESRRSGRSRALRWLGERHRRREFELRRRESSGGGGGSEATAAGVAVKICFFFSFKLSVWLLFWTTLTPTHVVGAKPVHTPDRKSVV